MARWLSIVKTETMMNLNTEHDASPLLGLAAGLGAGLVASFVMSEFQALLARADITSGVSGAPSTETAADRLSQTLSGRPLRRSQRPAAGEAVHYGVGSLVGAVYGAAVELEPRIAFGEGAAFGAAAATVVDETLVPAAGLGDPFWKAPLSSHPYSYLSHLVFGVTTEAARKLFRRLLGDAQAGAATLGHKEPRPPLATAGPGGWRALALAFLLGATAGPRTSAPLTVVGWAARLGWIGLEGSPLAFLASRKTVMVVTPMALGELIADKLPATPDRTEPTGVIARLASGAVSGAALVGGRSSMAAVAGERACRHLCRARASWPPVTGSRQGLADCRRRRHAGVWRRSFGLPRIAGPGR